MIRIWFLFMCLFVYGQKLPTVKLEKALLYNRHSLKDTFNSGKQKRVFQWHKIAHQLDYVTAFQKQHIVLGILQNYKNRNGLAPLVKNIQKNKYNHQQDTLGVERNQAIPLYRTNDLTAPERYGPDGALIAILQDSAQFIKVTLASFRGVWMVPRKYIKTLDSVTFDKAIFIDRTNQYVTTLENADSVWLIRSMNPATTGLHRPPYYKETPTGIFVLQNKIPKMYYTKDGSYQNAGFAPYASRFSRGAYIHGVPVNYPDTVIHEYSYTLGTTPRSHMCVRNATSHAKFIYDWAPIDKTIVIVIE